MDLIIKNSSTSISFYFQRKFQPRLYLHYPKAINLILVPDRNNSKELQQFTIIFFLKYLKYELWIKDNIAD